MSPASLKVLGLFSGIGGFELGLQRAGFEIAAMCEIDPYCRTVLGKHWPSVPVHDDVTTREYQEGEADVITGGFPCQDISVAGNGAGLAGARSGLWRELVRAIRLVRPRHAIVENVAALLARGMGTVLGDLAEIGYDAEWHCIPARAVGAPHRRDRVWIVADPCGPIVRHEPGRRSGARGAGAAEPGHDGAQGPMAHATGRGQRADGRASRQGGHAHERSTALADTDRQRQPQHAGSLAERGLGAIVGGEAMAHAHGPGLEGRACVSGYLAEQLSPAQRSGALLADADDIGGRIEQQLKSGDGARARHEFDGRRWWLTEPDVGRVAHGIPARVDRLRSLGNAVVPQIPELIGRAILHRLDREAA